MFNRNKKQSKVPEVVLREATKPYSLDPDAFSYNAEETAKAYLKSIYSQSMIGLPSDLVTEEMYYKARDIIESDRKITNRTCSDIVISEVKFSDYSSNRYSVRSFSYDISYTITGFYGAVFTEMQPYAESRTDTFTFVNDARLGFILAEHKTT